MKVYLFDDGTIESKLLRYDSERNPDIEIEVIKRVYKPDNILNYLPQVPNDATVHFHFCKEDFLKYDIDSQRNKIRSLSPNLSLFFAYEFLNKDVAVSKAQLAGIQIETDKWVVKEVTELEDALKHGLVEPEPEPEPPKKIPPKIVYDAQNVENETTPAKNKKGK
jgi:hypothetical protein